jgi:soluble lytic murein transglycosylase-like protein
MINRFNNAALAFLRSKMNQSVSRAAFIGTVVNTFTKTAHHTVMIVGIGAIAGWGILFVKPEIADQIKALSPFSEATAQATTVAVAAPQNDLMDVPSEPFAKQNEAIMSADGAKRLGTPVQQQRVTYWLSKRYRVAGDATNMLVSAAYLTSKETKLDPLLILSVMAIESGFNPFAESPVGAQGLMQVMSKVHHARFQELGGIKAALNPVANIRVGAGILQEYVRRAGSVEAGLKLYVGAAAFETDAGYGARVMAEYRRLKDVANGKKVPIYTTPILTPQPKPAIPAADPNLLIEAESNPSHQGGLTAAGTSGKFTAL